MNFVLDSFIYSAYSHGRGIEALGRAMLMGKARRSDKRRLIHLFVQQTSIEHRAAFRMCAGR